MAIFSKKSSFLKSVRKGNIQKVKDFLDEGIEVDLRDNRGYTPLMIATDEGHSEIAKILIDAGANINAKSNVNIMRPPINISSSDRYSEFENLLYEGDERLNNWEVTDYTDFQVNAILFELTIENCIKDNRGHDQTALILASDNGGVDVVRMLINTRAELDLKNINEDTALMRASMRGHTEIVEILCEAGADLNLKGKIGFIFGESEYDFSMTTLMKATCGRKENVVKELIKAGADVNTKDIGSIFDNALCIAAYFGDNEICNNLIKAGANINEKMSFFPILHYAAMNGNKETARIIIREGADINNRFEKNGITALMWAARNGHYDTVKYLLDEGADLNIKDNKGRTALMRAKDKYRYEIVDLLQCISI